MTDLTTETVEFLGERFHVAERVGLMPMMTFAKVAQSGVDTDSIAGLAAMHDLLEEALHPDEWDRFQNHARKERASGEELMAVVGEVAVIVAARPTGRSSDSSAGPRTIEPSSTEGSSSPGTGRVIDRFNQGGRPDLALLVRKREESLTA